MSKIIPIKRSYFRVRNYSEIKIYQKELWKKSGFYIVFFVLKFITKMKKYLSVYKYRELNEFHHKLINDKCSYDKFDQQKENFLIKRHELSKIKQFISRPSNKRKSRKNKKKKSFICKIKILIIYFK